MRQHAVKILLHFGIELLEPDRRGCLPQRTPHGVVGEIPAVAESQMNVVAIQLFKCFNRSLLRGDVFGDLRQQVLGKCLTNLASRMEPT